MEKEERITFAICDEIRFYHRGSEKYIRYIFGKVDYIEAPMPILKMNIANLLLDRVNHLFGVNFKYYSGDIPFYKFFLDIHPNDKGIVVIPYAGVSIDGLWLDEGEWYQKV
jgi:hypothetical protein